MTHSINKATTNKLEEMGIFIYYTTRGLKILGYTRRVARKHHEIVDRVVFPATRRVIENFPSSSCIRVNYIMNKLNK
jgi:outer membrane scaffolding protein for murein synthesis (MipA/OmpV family)